MRATKCGRIHLGPVCINGAGPKRPTCMLCGQEVTQYDRMIVERMWRTVRTMLSKYRRSNA